MSKGSAGYVAARGNVGAANLNIPSIRYKGSDVSAYLRAYDENNYKYTTFPPLSGTISASTISGGSTDLTVKEYSARLISSTELECDGPVEWQVIEFK